MIKNKFLKFILFIVIFCFSLNLTLSFSDFGVEGPSAKIINEHTIIIEQGDPLNITFNDCNPPTLTPISISSLDGNEFPIDKFRSGVTC